MAITYPASARFTTGEMYCKSTDSDNIHIIASMPTYCFTGYAYNAVAKGKTDADSEY